MQVAVKTLLFRDNKFGGEVVRRRCLNEAAICATLHHPNVVSTYSHSVKALSGDTGRVLQPEEQASAKHEVRDWKLYIIQVRRAGSSASALCATAQAW